GIETQIDAALIEHSKCAWKVRLNLTYEHSEILELVGGQQNIGNTIRVGYPRRIRWGLDYYGVNPADGRPMWIDEDGNLTYSHKEADKKVIGSQLPDYYGGFRNEFSYGPLTLSMLFNYEYGKDIRNYTHNVFMMRPHRGPRTLSRDMFARWQQPGDITQVPRAYTESSFP